MKNLFRNKLLLFGVVTLIGFGSCKKEFAGNETPVQSPKPSNPVDATFGTIQNDILMMGANPCPMWSYYTPTFSNFNSVHFYELASANLKFAVYRFEEGPNYDMAKWVGPPQKMEFRRRRYELRLL